MASKVLPVSLMSLFSDIVISCGSKVIEEIHNGVNLGRFLELTSCSDSYLDSTGSFENAQSNPASRTSFVSISGRQWRIPALKMSGFLNCGKMIKPSDFGGITIACTLAPTTQLFSVRNAADSIALTLSSVQLFYDTCIVSQAYSAFYNEAYLSRGLRLTYDTWTSSVATTNVLATTLSIPFNVSCRRAKAVVSVIRDTTQNSALYPYDAFVSNNITSYTYELNGTRYPQSSVSGYPRIFEQLQKFNYSKMDCQRSTLSLAQFSTDLAVPTTLAAINNLKNGKCALVYDLEKYGSTSESGVMLTPGTCSLILTTTSGVTAAAVTTFVHYSKALVLLNGQIETTQ
jgi:hypothetical protein